MGRLNYLPPFKLHFSLVVTREAVLLFTGNVSVLCTFSNIPAAAASGIASNSELSSSLRGQALQYDMAGSWPAFSTVQIVAPPPISSSLVGLDSLKSCKNIKGIKLKAETLAQSNNSKKTHTLEEHSLKPAWT